MAQKYFVEVTDSGNTMWYQDTEMKKLHRVDGPAVEWADGAKHWYKDGVLHRLDNPAVERPCGERIWFCDGQRHRLDGPAFEGANGDVEYWIEGKEFSRAAFECRVKELTQPAVKEMIMAELEAALGYPVKIIK